MRLGEIVAGKPARPDDAGNARRLFHVEHTQTRGSSVWVFDPWRCALVQHPQMTALWTALVTDRTDEARRRLIFAVRDYSTGPQPTALSPSTTSGDDLRVSSQVEGP